MIPMVPLLDGIVNGRPFRSRRRRRRWKARTQAVTKAVTSKVRFGSTKMKAVIRAVTAYSVVVIFYSIGTPFLIIMTH